MLSLVFFFQKYFECSKIIKKDKYNHIGFAKNHFIPTIRLVQDKQLFFYS